MSFNLLFTIAGAYVVPFWIGMILLPNWSITKKVMNSWLPFIPLFAFYAYYFVVSFNLESAIALAVPQLEDFVRILSQNGPAGSTWVHILLMDLFVGRWIYWEGQKKQILTTHSLILCPLVGPIGLLSHFITELLFYNNDEGDRSEETKTTASKS